MSDQTTEAETRLLAYLANDPSSGPWPWDADIHELIAEVRALRESVRLADAYIDKSPCDPDIYADQWQAWKVYETDRKANPNRPRL